eukprot:CAMPEP_0206189932 /NCGR_PEP_ID=MMETSP0166-20121206/4449_1 /ASSEMBLY_ACC=CAM_ASM_000260 /TAXON_ID=95228 /ORGANISM="Vannella robusta, Strain DIVA3 518/3/11/1/6" /LENGTH=146 /DNA_ID=CAMNT_0053605915 /DNA_START=639 /DNA_END=1079 /DNA_ORIENTATION=+
MATVKHVVSEPFNFRKSMIFQDLDTLLKLEATVEEEAEQQPKSARLRNRVSKSIKHARRKNKGKSLPSDLKNDANTIVHMAPWKDLADPSDPEDLSEPSTGHERFEGEFERLLECYAAEVHCNDTRHIRTSDLLTNHPKTSSSTDF